MIQQVTRTIEDRVVGRPRVASAIRQYLGRCSRELNAPVAPTPQADRAGRAAGPRVRDAREPRALLAEPGPHRRIARCRRRQRGALAAARRADPLLLRPGRRIRHALPLGRLRRRLAEVLLLRQVTELASRVGQQYPGGVRFSLVIDDLGAYLVEDVPVAQTLAYCRKLRQLVDDLGLSALTDLIVTSEYFSVSDFAEVWPSGDGVPALGSLTNKPHRPAGHNAVGAEARTDAERARRSDVVRQAAEQLLAPMIRGVYLTGRTTAESLGFRPFPGGDSCGGAGRGRADSQRAGRRSARWC